MSNDKKCESRGSEGDTIVLLRRLKAGNRICVVMSSHVVTVISTTEKGISVM